MEHDGYQELANAIVIRAAKDYRILLRFHQKHPDKAIAESRIRELERDVHTSFFQSLTTLDVERIFAEIRAEFE